MKGALYSGGALEGFALSSFFLFHLFSFPLPTPSFLPEKQMLKCPHLQ